MLKDRIQTWENAVIRTEERISKLSELLESIGKSHINELTPQELFAAQLQVQGNSYAMGNAADVDESNWTANNVTG